VDIAVTPSGALVADVRGGSKASSLAAAPHDTEYLIARAAPGVWHTVLLHIEWETGDDGLTQIWHRRANGSFSRLPQVSARGPNVLTVAGDVLPVYAETGLYRSRASTVQTSTTQG
jgi:hypothetical protein